MRITQTALKFNTTVYVLIACTIIIGAVLLSTRIGLATERDVHNATPVITLKDAHRMALAHYPKVKNIDDVSLNFSAFNPINLRKAAGHYHQLNPLN
jgi:hypothetical protein